MERDEYWTAYAQQDEWVQRDGSKLVSVMRAPDGNIHITPEAFAGLMEMAGFVQIKGSHDG